ncbi:hypothetical protein PPL_11974 [Heterostelium album PN500]|uniref:Uncharacterized protein n=1 Tax=Heterostelium pallidum (strain ATCC 26659 / Pp 5 / PN500) TaxID=670386 RepID=D3BV02_HETP5|nr:hypothetical protein PPL_11974 [Heterostelium album PN500]EFA74940.1 hypothetical protein PPL_11974 [Heterostelium album PN500]|eukprot:XP_020427074.1 hypothetical protein PPL_11974 [Heterostelium album PN500]
MEVDGAIINSIENDHLEILKILWPHFKTSPITFPLRTKELLIDNEDTDLLKWLYENITDFGEMIPISYFFKSIEKGNLSMAKLIFEHIPKPNTIEISKTLYFAPFTSDILCQNHYEILEWIFETFKDELTKEKVIVYKQVLESNYPNSIESIEIINKYLK